MSGFIHSREGVGQRKRFSVRLKPVVTAEGETPGNARISEMTWDEGWR